MRLPDPETSDEFVEQIADKIDNKDYEEFIDRAYLHAHRIEEMDKTIENLFGVKVE